MSRISYSLDVSYLDRAGNRANHDLQVLGTAAAVKTRVGEKDALYLQFIRSEQESGDVRQLYDPATSNSGLRIESDQPVDLIAGWTREWSEESRILAVFGRLDATQRTVDPNANVLTVFEANGVPTAVAPAGFGSRRFQSFLDERFLVWSGEVQQLWENESHSVVAGLRHQQGDFESDSQLTKFPGQLVTYPSGLVSVSPGMSRTTGYLYENWTLHPSLKLLGGIAYDVLTHPENTQLPPLQEHEWRRRLFSPKAGVVWTPDENWMFRGAYSRSMSGLSFDNSLRLEPVHFAGFVQVYRSLIPESIAGGVAGAQFDLWNLDIQYSPRTGTWLMARAERL
ncbi:MAG: TonB-dependent receptor [Verrucomicrobia bacterium]|nr:TonB-dependent receptor [Verrucomicrobiota bacterium]